MVDVAKIAVGVETAGLEKGEASLNAFGKEAKKASSSANNLNKMMKEVARIFSITGLSIAKSNLAVIQASQGATKEQINLAQSAVKAAEGAHKEAISMKELQNAVRNTTSTYKEFEKIQKQLKVKTGLESRSAAQSNRFNSANMFAQFQDIAVTASMGMNPMLIAMQQGTQLQYILAQSNAPLKDFIAGLKYMITPVSLLAIGLTGLVAKLIQMIDWLSVGKTLLTGLGNVFNYISSNIEVFTTAIVSAGAALLVFNGGAILSTIANLGKLGLSALAAGAKMASAWVLGMGPVGWVLTTISTLTTTWLLFPETIKKVFTAVGTFIKNTLNQWIGYIISFGYKVSGLFDILANAPFMGWSKAVKEYEDEVNRLATGIDYIGGALGTIKDVAIVIDDATGNVISKTANTIGETGKNMVDGLKDITKSVSDSFKSWSDGLGDVDEKAKKTKSDVEKLAEAWANVQTTAQNKIEDLMMQRGLIGANTYISTYEQTLADLTRQAEGHGVVLTPEMQRELEGDSEKIAKLSYEVENMSDQFNFAKNTTNSFFSDMRQGLKNGESAWKTFGDAVTNVLDKILDKIMNIGVDALFNAGFQAGWFGGNISSGSTWNPATSAPAVKPTFAANGGVFSNGVYNSPTLFKFGNGGRFGVMGEAGPEAVMPLKRGPDGSLGVQANGFGGDSPVIVNVVNNSNAEARVERRQTSQGTEIDVTIDQLVAEKMSRPGTSSNNALRSFNNQRLIAR